jgi:hypothetical protein
LEPAEEGDDPGCQDPEAGEGAGDGEKLAGEILVVSLVGGVEFPRLDGWLRCLAAVDGVGGCGRGGVRGRQCGCRWRVVQGGVGFVWSRRCVLRGSGDLGAGAVFGWVAEVVGDGRQEEFLAGVDQVAVVRWCEPVRVGVNYLSPEVCRFGGGGGSIPSVDEGRFGDTPEAVTLKRPMVACRPPFGSERRLQPLFLLQPLPLLLLFLRAV